VLIVNALTNTEGYCGKNKNLFCSHLKNIPTTRVSEKRKSREVVLVCL
jgi:hypothetical protein